MELSSRVRRASSIISSSQEFGVLTRLLTTAIDQRTKVTDPSSSSRWKKALKQGPDQVTASSTWKLEESEGLTVIGLGSFADQDSRSELRVLQLAISLSLQGIMPQGTCYELIDPAFSQEDVKLIETLGGKPIPQPWNKTLLKASPLIYMPCCTRSLMQRVIDDVIDSGCPAAIIGNSLTSFKDSWFLLPGDEGNDEEGMATSRIKYLLAESRVRELYINDIAGAHRASIALHII